MAVTLSVTQVNTYIKSVLDNDVKLKNIYVEGEISNFKHYYQSGHMYFTLKDSSSQLKCVMFSWANSSLRFEPENGMGVICFGQISAYERDGVYQLYVQNMQPRGIGSLQIAYEQLKAKLEEEGLFDSTVKKSIPRYPCKIGVATSNMGAAVEDIKNVISRRFPLAEIFIVPTIVQGDAASLDIVNSLHMLDNMGLDVIIVGRGGGSIEDLWAFNTEPVARAVYNCKTPVISAVGHETDYTICDFVADLRAPTPSAAAELAVPDIANEFIKLDDISDRLRNFVDNRIAAEELRLSGYVKNSALSNADVFIERLNEKISDIQAVLSRNMSNLMDNKKRLLSEEANLLNALSPLATIGRGYSITIKDNVPVSSVNGIKTGDNVKIILNDGKLNAVVSEVTLDE